jgi:archaellum biogenesis protein FlaJ (TadC family)
MRNWTDAKLAMVLSVSFVFATEVANASCLAYRTSRASLSLQEFLYVLIASFCLIGVATYINSSLKKARVKKLEAQRSMGRAEP